MILVDPRVGSGDLEPHLRALQVPAELYPLEFADAMFLGRGPDGVDVAVGIEIKTVSDLVNSLTSGRLAGHQIPGLVATYHWVWLLIEGGMRCGKSGELEVWRGGKWSAFTDGYAGGKVWQYRDLHRYLLTLEHVCGVRCRVVPTRREVVQTLVDLYRWWTEKAWEQHKGHVAFNAAPEHTWLVPNVPVVMKVAGQLPGLGVERAGKAAAAFGTVAGMVAASEQEWQKVVGKGTGTKVWRAIHGET